MVSSLYKELVYRNVEKIKNKPYFRWPNKMSGDITRRNQSLYCSYHQDHRHTTEDCRTLKDHLRQLEKASYLAEFLVREDSCLLDLKGGAITRTLTSTQGLIRVIHAARKWVETMKTPPRVLTVNSASNIELEGPITKRVSGRMKASTS